MSVWDLPCYVCLRACVLARITVMLTLSRSDSGFLGVSSVLLIRGAAASEPRQLTHSLHVISESIKEAPIDVLIQVCLLLSRVH